MLLSQLDDYPIHQVPSPVRYVGTSDRNFYDRYYFNLQDPQGEQLMIMGLGVYPNLGVMDAFAVMRAGDDYRVVRASKHIGADPADMTIGPFRLEVVEGLQSIRLAVEPNEWGLDFDMQWDAATAPIFEMPRFRRDAIGRVSHDHCRFNQVGAWTGHLTLDGTRREVDGWVGTRDRSWGVRPVGEPEPERLQWRDPSGQPTSTWFWNYVMVLFPEYSITYIVEEMGDGRRTLQDAYRIPRDGGPAEPIGQPQHEIEFVPGTRRMRRARIQFTDPSGEPFVMEAESLTWAPIFLGTGYRQYDHWRHGKDQGALAVEGLTYDLNDPDVAPALKGVVDNAVHCRIGDVSGSGIFEFAVFGSNDKYGFENGEDVAS
jgi:hypothetical protein